MDKAGQILVMCTTGDTGEPYYLNYTTPQTLLDFVVQENWGKTKIGFGIETSNEDINFV